MKNILLLGSTSQSRQQLLRDARIPFEVIPHMADEMACDWGQSLPKIVSSISHFKMEHMHLPDAPEGTIIFVVTADTLSQDMQGEVHGKPVNREDAIAKIKAARKGSRLCTAFCLDKRIMRNGSWDLLERIEEVVHAEYTFDVPDEWIERYLQNSVSMQASNAIAIEGYGGQFLRTISGSYTTIIGLPMFELREALSRLDFFS